MKLRILRRKPAQSGESFWDMAEQQFPFIGAGGSWADEQPDPGDDELEDEHGRGECAA